MLSVSSTKILKEIVNTIIDSVHPEKIILFGSRARKDHRPHSDYDLMVIKRGLKNERSISRRIYRALFDQKINRAVDIIVVDKDKLRIQMKNPYLIYSWALKEGKVLYG